MRTQGLRTIKVTTGDHPFFTPARRMYEAFGFVTAGRRAGGPIPGHGLLDYELPQLDRTHISAAK